MRERGVFFMERVVSDEEKIRRAIEISHRRNQGAYSRETARVNVNDKKNYKLFKKMVIQIIICLLIYVIFYLIHTTNYAFSEEVMQSTSNVLNYDINFQKLYQDWQQFFAGMTSPMQTEEIENTLENSADTSINVENQTVEENIQANASISNLAAVEIEVEEKEEKKQDKQVEQEKKQMEKDAEMVKKLCKFQKPLSGKITSEFGDREVTLKGMTSDHKGIDIAANKGTSIKAAMAGTVSVAEENSEYGKFIKIVDGDVMTVYAHCSSLSVKKGDKVKKGQIIAKVGSTGISTGSHLHFEIRFQNRNINPRLVINF